MTTATAVPIVYGTHDTNTINQLIALGEYGSVEHLALMADGHLGYSQPIGGVVAYSEHISPSGVGFDIACGNMAVKTDLTYADLTHPAAVADLIAERVEFGVGGETPGKSDHALFDYDAWHTLREVAGTHTHDALKAKARKQLGSVGSGNHYVDVFAECDEDHDGPFADSPVWVGVHFGSRGFGHTIASGFLDLGAGRKFGERAPRGERVESEIPTLFHQDSDEGQAYIELMELAGSYAYAGREHVVAQVLDILGASAVDTVHNHHNFAWHEEHHGKGMWVIRKGATPLAKGQRSFIGGSMCDISVIVQGNGLDAEHSLDSTVHGAGRIMSRTQAKGKTDRRTGEVKKVGRVTRDMFNEAVADYGIHLRGGDLDESPFVYRQLDDVLDRHINTDIETRLRPLIVCMAGSGVSDPYKD